MRIDKTRNRNRLILVFCGLFPLFFAMERYFEKLGKVDSIGTWYTAFCAFIYSTIATMIFALVLKLLKLTKKRDNQPDAPD